MTEEVLLYELEDGNTILMHGKAVKIKSIELSDQTMGECNDRLCCGDVDYWDVYFEDGSFFWGHGNTPVDKVL